MSIPLCSICYITYSGAEAVASTRCGHVFHKQCLTQWFGTSHTCPQCRKSSDPDQISRIYIDFEGDAKLNGCELCKTFQDALNTAQTEKDKISKSLEDKIQENEQLIKRINELVSKQSTNENSLLLFQSASSLQQDTIDVRRPTLTEDNKRAMPEQVQNPEKKPNRRRYRKMKHKNAGAENVNSSQNNVIDRPSTGNSFMDNSRYNNIPHPIQNLCDSPPQHPHSQYPYLQYPQLQDPHLQFHRPYYMPFPHNSYTYTNPN